MALAIGIGATACLPDTAPPPTADGYQRAMFDAVLAGGHSCDMQRAGYLYHTDLSATLNNNPDFAAYWSLGENVVVAPSSMSAQDLESIWMGSPNHQANILNPNFNLVGMAACFAPDGRVWATQDFGAL
jgi:uncharacterized protein YkwD